MTNKTNTKKNSKDLEIVTIEIDDIKDTIKLKKPNEVYYELYKKAREKAEYERKKAAEQAQKETIEFAEKLKKGAKIK